MNESSSQDSLETAAMEEMYINLLETNNAFTEAGIRAAIAGLGLFPGARVLDAPCGVGSHAFWIAQAQADTRVVGFDISSKHIARARSMAAGLRLSDCVTFMQGDITNPDLPDNSFDFVWCCDGLWLGPPETGCFAEQPYGVLDQFKRILKPGGKIAILFWSAHRFLPGYPLLEAALNAPSGSNLPWNWMSKPETHALRALAWLEQIGCIRLQAHSFCSDFQAPFTRAQEIALIGTMNMLWNNAKQEIAPEIWEQYERLTDPAHADFILRQRGYAGFIVYSMYTGELAPV